MKNNFFRLCLGIITIVGLLVINEKIDRPFDTKEEQEREEIGMRSNEGTIPESEMFTVSSSEMDQNNEETTEGEEVALYVDAPQEPVELEEEIVNTEFAEMDTGMETEEQKVAIAEESEIVAIEKTEELNDLEVLTLLSDSLVTNSSGYSEHYDDTMNVFAEDVTNSIAFNTAVSYNLFNHNIQNVVYSTRKLQEYGDKLVFDAGIVSGGEGTVSVAIFLSNSEIPDYQFVLDATQAPYRQIIDLDKGESLKIVVCNNASVSNKVVFYNFALVSEEE